MPLDDVGAFFDRLADRVGDAWEDRPTADLDIKAWLADLRESARLTPTFTAIREEAQGHLDATMAEFGRAVVVYEQAPMDAWPEFVVGEFRPAMIRAIQDLCAAQLRDDMDRPGGPIHVFRAMRSRLIGLRGLMGDWS